MCLYDTIQLYDLQNALFTTGFFVCHFWSFIIGWEGGCKVIGKGIKPYDVNNRFRLLSKNALSLAVFLNILLFGFCKMRDINHFWNVEPISCLYYIILIKCNPKFSIKWCTQIGYHISSKILYRNLLPFLWHLCFWIYKIGWWRERVKSTNGKEIWPYRLCNRIFEKMGICLFFMIF